MKNYLEKKLPKRVKIGPDRYDIRFVESIDVPGFFGQIRWFCAEPHINLITKFTETQTVNTFIHEVLHGIIHSNGTEYDDKLEEEIVTGVANGLTIFMQDNPEVFPMLQKALKDNE